MEEISPGIYVETFFPGINVGFICTDEGAVAIDAPPLPADGLAWRERIEEIAGGPVRWAVLTDDHPDRLLGIGALGAPVVAGRGTLSRLREGKEGLWHTLVEEWVRRWPEREGIEQSALVIPEVAVDGHITLQGSLPVTVAAVHGAAPGSVWVRVAERRILFAGDTVVVGTWPLVASSPDTRAWLKALVDLRRARTPIRLIVPGRGPVSGKEATYPLSEYLQLVRRRVRSLHIAGGTRGDLLALIPEFMTLFPADEEREEIQQRVRAGLERVYEEMRPPQAEE